MVLMSKTDTKKEEKKVVEEKGVVKVGMKTPTMSYTPFLLSEFSNNKKVTIKARGRAISKAVDLAQIAKNKFIKDCKIEDIKIGTVQFPARDSDKMINVSTIEIVLTR